MGKWLDEVIKAASESETLFKGKSFKDDATTEISILENLLQEKGYAKMFSKILEQEIYIAKNELEAKKLENRLRSKSNPDLAVIYTMQEVGELIKERKVSVEGLKLIHEAKEVFGSSSNTLFHGKGPL